MSADAETLDTLASIERVLVADRCGVREALQAAHRLGELNGMLKIAEAEELAKRHAMKDRRTSSIIAAAIQSASLTPHEMGQILGAIAGVISWVSRREPELESVAADLSDAYEAFLQAEDQRENRLYTESKRRKA